MSTDRTWKVSVTDWPVTCGLPLDIVYEKEPLELVPTNRLTKGCVANQALPVKVSRAFARQYVGRGDLTSMTTTFWPGSSRRG